MQNGILAFPKMFVLFLRGGSSPDSFFHSLRNKCQDSSTHRANKKGELFYFFLFLKKKPHDVPNVVNIYYDLTESYDFSNIVFVFIMGKSKGD